MAEENRYCNLSDEELILRFRQGDTEVMEYLLEKYKNLVRRHAHMLYLSGGDADDLMQEGMIGLFKAIRGYDAAGTKFYPFAELCIKRQLYTAVRLANRKKHAPLNDYTPAEEEADYPDAENDPQEILADIEQSLAMLAALQDNLSKMEKKVLDLYLEGMNYREIAAVMDKPPKSIDNAIQRIRNKAHSVWEL